MIFLVGHNIAVKTPDSVEFGVITDRRKLKGRYVYTVMSEKGSVFYDIDTNKKINAIYISEDLTKKLSSYLENLLIKTSSYEESP